MCRKFNIRNRLRAHIPIVIINPVMFVFQLHDSATSNDFCDDQTAQIYVELQKVFGIVLRQTNCFYCIYSFSAGRETLHTTMRVWKSENNLLELCLLFHQVDPREGNQVMVWQQVKKKKKKPLTAQSSNQSKAYYNYPNNFNLIILIFICMANILSQ